MAPPSYVIGLGSNRPHGRHGPPARVLAAAIRAMRDAGLVVRSTSAVETSAPLGPSLRRFANAAAWVETDLAPPALLVRLKRIERAFGRRRGRRWGARVLDLDILAWSEGRWTSPGLQVPHPAIAQRAFAVGPAASLVPGWRLPRHRASLRQIAARLRKQQPVDRAAHTP